MAKDKINALNKDADVKREIGIHAELEHENIARLEDHSQDDVNYYLELEYCDGGDLFNYIKEMKEYNELQISQIISQILKGISYCH